MASSVDSPQMDELLLQLAFARGDNRRGGPARPAWNDAVAARAGRRGQVVNAYGKPKKPAPPKAQARWRRAAPRPGRKPLAPKNARPVKNAAVPTKLSAPQALPEVAGAFPQPSAPRPRVPAKPPGPRRAAAPGRRVVPAHPRPPAGCQPARPEATQPMTEDAAAAFVRLNGGGEIRGLRLFEDTVNIRVELDLGSPVAERLLDGPRAPTPEPAVEPPTMEPLEPMLEAVAAPTPEPPEPAVAPVPDEPTTEAPPTPAAPAPEPLFAVGARVEARFEDGDEWYAGVIEATRGDAYDVAYDDGDRETNVAAALVREEVASASMQLAPEPTPEAAPVPAAATTPRRAELEIPPPRRPPSEPSEANELLAVADAVAPQTVDDAVSNDASSALGEDASDGGTAEAPLARDDVAAPPSLQPTTTQTTDAYRDDDFEDFEDAMPPGPRTIGAASKLQGAALAWLQYKRCDAPPEKTTWTVAEVRATVCINGEVDADKFAKLGWKVCNQALTRLKAPSRGATKDLADRLAALLVKT